MALIKLSAVGITAMSGASGGSVFAFNRGGKYVRNWAKPTNPQTSKQTMMRSIFGYVSQLWGTLSQEDVDLWNSAGANQERTNALGEQHSMTGFTYFKAVNQNRLHSGWETPLLTPPSIMAIPAVISQDFEYVEGGNKELILKLGDSVNAGDYIASVGWAVVSANQNRDYGSIKNKFQNRVRIPIPAGDEIDLTSVLPQNLKFGETLYFQLHIHSADGQKGTEVTGRTNVSVAFQGALTPDTIDGTTGGTVTASAEIGGNPLNSEDFTILLKNDYAGISIDQEEKEITVAPGTTDQVIEVFFMYNNKQVGWVDLAITSS